MRKFLKYLTPFILSIILPVILLGYDKSLVDLANYFANYSEKLPPKALMQVRLQLLSSYDEMSNLRNGGHITDEAFQRVQSSSQQILEERFKWAAEQSGLNVSKQVSQSTSYKQKLWADNDIFIERPGGKPATFHDYKTQTANFSKGMDQLYAENGVPVAKGTNWTKTTKTDFMVSPNSPDFAPVVEDINKSGGRAYRSPDAARVEAYIRLGRDNLMTFNEAVAYHNEMKSQVKINIEIADQLTSKINQLKTGNFPPGHPNAELLEKLTNQLQEVNHLTAKYLGRAENVHNLTQGRYGVGQKTKLPEYVSEAVERGQGTAAQAEKVGMESKNLLNQLEKDFKNMTGQASKFSKMKDTVSVYEQKMRFGVWDKLSNLAGGEENLKLKLGTPDRYIREKFKMSEQKYNSISKGPSINRIQRGLGWGGGILMALQIYDVVTETYRTGNYYEGMKSLAYTFVFGKILQYGLTAIFVANPVAGTVIGVVLITYFLAKEVSNRLTPEWIEANIYKSGQYDEQAKKALIQMYLDAIAKGHKLANGMTPEEGLKKLMENYDKGGRMFTGIFAPSTGGVITTIENSTIINTVEGSSEATGKSKINTGISAVNAKVEDSYIENTGDVEAIAKENSKINTGVSINQSTVQRSFISTRTEGKVEAVNNSTINTGLSANNSEIKDSNITSEVEGTFSARDNSTLNAGVQANNTKLTNATISNTVQGANTTVKNRSTVNQGTKFNKDDNEQPAPDLQFNFGK
ncbi:MAG: hypothetical protein WCR55_00835 [Lentisphaerota bacterium]